MLQGWNSAVAALHPVITPDTCTLFVPYGAAFPPKNCTTFRSRISRRQSGVDVWQRRFCPADWR
jgi:hypothetical protein